MLKLSQAIILRSALGIFRARNHSGSDLQNCLRHKVHKQNNNHRKTEMTRRTESRRRMAFKVGTGFYPNKEL